MSPLPPFSLDLVVDAARRLSPYVHETPIKYDRELDAVIKWENNQVGRSFKLRGVLNEALQLPTEVRQRGLVTCTTGNHGLAVASAAIMLETGSVVYVPTGISSYKTSQIIQLGATIVRVEGNLAAAEHEARVHAELTGAHYMSAANSEPFIRGIATLAAEWLRQAPELTCFVIPTGGGGLLRAVSWVVKSLSRSSRVWAVQSTASPYLFSHYYTGNHANVRESDTLAGGLLGAPDQDFPWLELPSICDGVLLVEEEEIANAMIYASEKYGEIVEGAGAVSIAIALRRSSRQRPTVGVLVSGGNVNPATYEQ